MSAGARTRFDPAMVEGLDEPVRRYFTHALRPGAPLGAGVRLRMRGRIKVGAWLPFRATWLGDGRSFLWSARVGWGPLSVLRAVDRFADGAGSMDVLLFGRVPVIHADDVDTARSAAGRAAVEAAIWAPAALLPSRGVEWRAEREDVIVASWDVPPERPEVRLELDAAGGVRRVMRWDGGAHGLRGYIPCGATVDAERRFGDLVLPSRVTVGWWYGTPRWAPFFRARLLSAENYGCAPA